MKNVLLLLVAIFLLCPYVIAGDSEGLTAADIQKLMQYKKTGKTPILYEAKLTSEVDRKTLEPKDNIDSIEPNKKISVWLKFFLPDSSENNTFTVSFKKGEAPQRSKEINLTKTKNGYGSYGYRTWYSMTPKKPGKYSAVVYYNDKTIKTLNFEVD